MTAGLADLFDDEPPNKTMLVVRDRDGDPFLIYRDDAEAAGWDRAAPGEHWFSDSGADPMTLPAWLGDATHVFAVVPLESTDLVWLINPRPGVPSDLPAGATVAFVDTIPKD
jgi:hypothetical protein